jgi:hypothetical protein
MMLIASEISEGLIENIDPDLIPEATVRKAVLFRLYPRGQIRTTERRRENKQDANFNHVKEM